MDCEKILMKLNCGLGQQIFLHPVANRVWVVVGGKGVCLLSPLPIFNVQVSLPGVIVPHLHPP